MFSIFLAFIVSIYAHGGPGGWHVVGPVHSTTHHVHTFDGVIGPSN